jgi:hypothetical protein
MRARDARRPPRLLPPPPGLNHVVLTGQVKGEPRRTQGPGGTPILLAEIGFPVNDPRNPKRLWTYARYLVEVPEGVGRGDLDQLHGGRPLLVAGQLSRRLVVPGSASQSGAILASLLKVGRDAEGDR